MKEIYVNIEVSITSEVSPPSNELTIWIYPSSYDHECWTIFLGMRKNLEAAAMYFTQNTENSMDGTNKQQKRNKNKKTLLLRMKKAWPH